MSITPAYLAYFSILLPSLGASLIAILLASFNRTMNRLSKPVLAISTLTLFSSILLDYLFLNPANSGLSERQTFFAIDSISSSFPIEIGIRLNNYTFFTSIVLLSILLILFYFSHKFMYRKEGYVRQFIYLGYLSSLVTLFSFSISIEESIISLIGIYLIANAIREQWIEISNSGDLNSTLSFSLISQISSLVALIILYLILGGYDFIDLSHLKVIISETNNYPYYLLLCSLFLLFLPVVNLINLIKNFFSRNVAGREPVPQSMLLSITMFSIYGCLIIRLKSIIIYLFG